MKIRRDLQRLNLLLWKIPREISLYKDPAEKGSCYLKVRNLYSANQWPGSHLDLCHVHQVYRLLCAPNWQSVLALMSLYVNVQSPVT